MQTTTTAPQTEPRTRVYKSHYGWCAETRWLIGTREWDITTMKRNNGIISTHAQLKNEDGTIFMMGAPANESFWLHRSSAMATEKSVTEVHAVSLQQFTAKKDAGELPQAENPIDIGQVFFSEGHWGQQRRAVFAIEGGGHYKTVLLDGSDIKTDSHVRPIEKKNGIGVYYKTGDTIPEDELLVLVEQAMTTIQERNQKEAAQKAIAAQLRADKIAVGAKVLPALPTWAKAVIVAELHRNTSDIMSDYFSHATDQVLYLAFSGHNRDLFDEMRKAALNCNIEDVRVFGVTPTVNDRDEARTERNKDWWHPKDEHREKYSMGSGYYLKHGHSNSSGWSVSKTSYGMRLEDLQIAIAEGRYFIPDGQPAAEKVGSAAIAGKASLSINEALGGIEIKFGEGRPQDKPAEDIIEALKGQRFQWHRGKKHWYRRIKPGLQEWATTFVNNYNAA